MRCRTFSERRSIMPNAVLERRRSGDRGMARGPPSPGLGRSWVMETFSTAQRAAAEAIGTALLVFVGAGSVPAILLLEGGTKAPFSGADLGFISMAFGLIVIAMVYTIGTVSGCHINPAVTFARAVDLGYGFGVGHFDHAATAWGSAIFIEALGTAILLFTILGIVDSRSPEGWAGLVIGLVIVGIIITVGPITNASLNPARAIGPLLITTLHGGVHNWTQQFLAYIPGNLIGAAAACLAYDWLATPRKILAPIKQAVTEPDRADLG